MIYILMILNSYWIRQFSSQGIHFALCFGAGEDHFSLRRGFPGIAAPGGLHVHPQDRWAPRPGFLLPVPRQQERREVQAGQEET